MLLGVWSTVELWRCPAVAVNCLIAHPVTPVLTILVMLPCLLSAVLLATSTDFSASVSVSGGQVESVSGSTGPNLTIQAATGSTQNVSPDCLSSARNHRI